MNKITITALRIILKIIIIHNYKTSLNKDKLAKIMSEIHRDINNLRIALNNPPHEGESLWIFCLSFSLALQDRWTDGHDCVYSPSCCLFLFFYLSLNFLNKLLKLKILEIIVIQ